MRARRLGKSWPASPDTFPCVCYKPHWTRQKRDFRTRSENSLRSEEHTSELQSPCNLVCRLLLEKKKSTEPCHGLPPSAADWMPATVASRQNMQCLHTSYACLPSSPRFIAPPVTSTITRTSRQTL